MRISDWSSDVCSSDLNTRRAFRSDLIVWGAWCRRRRIVPARAGSDDVAAWIRALSGADSSDETVRAMATIERYIVNVGWAYRMAGLDDPTAQPLVRLEKKAARKALGVRQRQARAKIGSASRRESVRREAKTSGVAGSLKKQTKKP